jgi:transcriptional regulator with XRE-family HTH domain
MAGNGGGPALFLGQELRRAREASGMTRPVLAEKFHISESLVKMWETGRRVPVPADLTQLDRFFGKEGLWVRFREQLVKTSTPLEWLGRWLEIESRATSLWTFEPSIVPGLLQTEDYARAILRAGEHDADLEEMIAARVERQRILTGEHGAPTFVALITEAVLRNNVGGPQVMIGQMGRLAELAEEDNKIIIQIIPASARVCARFTGPFIIAAFDGGEVASLDNAIHNEIVEDVEDLIRLRRMFDVYREEALPRQASIEFILRVMEQWKNHQT